MVSDILDLLSFPQVGMNYGTIHPQFSLARAQIRNGLETSQLKSSVEVSLHFSKDFWQARRFPSLVSTSLTAKDWHG